MILCVVDIIVSVSHLKNNTGHQGSLLQTWINLNPTMDNNYTHEK